jgi:hypothetical protein
MAFRQPSPIRWWIPPEFGRIASTRSTTAFARPKRLHRSGQNRSATPVLCCTMVISITKKHAVVPVPNRRRQTELDFSPCCLRPVATLFSKRSGASIFHPRQPASRCGTRRCEVAALAMGHVEPREDRHAARIGGDLLSSQCPRRIGRGRPSRRNHPRNGRGHGQRKNRCRQHTVIHAFNVIEL